MENIYYYKDKIITSTPKPILLNNKEIPKEYVWFINPLKNQKNINLTTFNNNIPTLSFMNSSSISNVTLNDSCNMAYTSYYNAILYYKFDYAKLSHELLHCASCIVLKDKHGTTIAVYAGFEQATYLKTSIGKAIDEGYTVLLDERYFNFHNDDIYPYEKVFAKKMEDIVGKELMEELYFSSNLKGLVEELAKYSTIDEVLHLLELLDDNLNTLMNEDLKDEKLAEEEEKLIIKNYEEALDILDKIVYQKAKLQYTKKR